MNAPTRIDPLAISLDHIDTAIAALVALRLDPSRDGQLYINMLSAIDTIEGCGSLQGTIADCEHDLSDEATCLVCEQTSCGCDQAYSDRVSWGLGSPSGSGLWL